MNYDPHAKVKMAGFLPYTNRYGPHYRTVILLQGSQGKQYRSTPDHSSTRGGRIVTASEISAWIRTYAKFNNGVYHITFGGGDPLDQADGLLDVLKCLHQTYGAAPKKRSAQLHVVIYTGREWAGVKKEFKEILRYIDAIACGPFQRENSCETNYSVLSSTNQVWVKSPSKSPKVLSAEEANGGPTDIKKLHLLQ